jgi:hypothetical protein
MGASSGVFFCVYEGLSKLVKRKDELNAVDYFTLFFASGIGAIAHRATGAIFYNGPVTNPLLSSMAPRIMLTSVLGMASVTTTFEFVHQLYLKS